jgi:hypothetical protein
MNPETTGMVSEAGVERRRSPRFSTDHAIEGASQDQQIGFRGTLCDLSAEGCRLRLDTHIPRGTPIQVRCDISGIGLQIYGEIVWAKPTTGGTLHGVLVTGFPSEEDAQFQRLYVRRLARRTPAAPPQG